MTARRSVALGAALTVLGIALAATTPVEGSGGGGGAADGIGRQTLGGVVILVGWALLAWGIHALGRGRP
ncbi:MAG TPA: hypothetical protein VKU41_16490 [Polyangiaceae bacterium]|nr:hypothetical protein [Polyangiaceae bacterium]